MFPTYIKCSLLPGGALSATFKNELSLLVYLASTSSMMHCSINK